MKYQTLWGVYSGRRNRDGKAEIEERIPHRSIDGRVHVHPSQVAR
jgi:hypothetical protein